MENRLSPAHKGYEYQDLLSVYYILENILKNKETNFRFDHKEHPHDKFDDLIIKNSDGYFKYQIKFSSIYPRKILEKKDLSAKSSYNLAIDELFQSWFLHPDKKNIELRLCLAWNEPIDELTEILKGESGNFTFSNFVTQQYKIDINKLWPQNRQPIISWRRFSIKSRNIKREDFKLFCEKLNIETNFPNSSHDISNPDNLEMIVLEQAEKIGIGIYPNEHLRKENFIQLLTAHVKWLRSNNIKLNIREIFTKFQIRTDYGSIEQYFPIDYSKNINLTSTEDKFIKDIFRYKKIMLLGEPGSGKSWFLNNITDRLEKDVRVVKHYCYTDLLDQYQKERIKIDVFYGNIISELIESYPELERVKSKKYASNLSELNLLLKKIEEPTVLLIDGLDHIKRVYKYRLYRDLPPDDIEIINEINKIEPNENIAIIIASQPVKELDQIKGFVKYKLKNWSIPHVKELMGKMYLNDITISGIKLSQLLFEKSEGNPLFLTYLIEELKSYSDINKQMIDEIPAYSYNLETYYTYLLSKLRLSDLVPQVLSAINFSLTTKELKDITGLGDFVDESLNYLLPVLKQNDTNSGHIIYHESFRRYIFEILQKKNINIKQALYEPITKWFESLEFYSHPKAYRYFFSFLADYGNYERISKYINKDYLKRSIYSGQSWGFIEKNYTYLMYSAVITKSISNVVIINEINKAISTVKNTYDELLDSYFEAMGFCLGFEKVSHLLVYEDKPTLDLFDGLKICYLIDNNKYVAPWKYFIKYFKKGKKIGQDDLKYLVRYYLANSDSEGLLKLLKNNLSTQNTENEFIFKKELKSYWKQDYIQELISKNKIIRELFQKSTNVSTELDDLEKLADEIVKFEHIFDADAIQLEYFYQQIRLHIDNQEIINKVIKKFIGKNWFNNWLIYYIKICQLKFQKSFNITELKSAFAYLTYNTDPFAGQPRTCDLYSIHNLIYSSINEGLSLINEDWNYFIELVNKLSEDTTTSIQKSIDGPLTTIKLFDLLIKNINKENIQKIIQILEYQYQDKKEYHLHINLSEYCYKLAIAFIINNQTATARQYFELGVDYMVGYTWRRDITIDDLIESIESITKIDKKIGNEYILKIKNLVDSIVEHTDGKDTKYYPVEWFEKFNIINFKNSALYLRNEYLNIRYDWRLEDSLRQLLINTYNKQNFIISALLAETLIIEHYEDFLLSVLDLIEKINDNVSKRILFTYVIRNIVDSENQKYSKNFLNKISTQLEIYNYPKESLLLKLDEKSSDNLSFGSDEIIRYTINPRKEFSNMTTDEFIEYVQKNSIDDTELQSIVYYISDFPELNDNKKIILEHLAGKNKDYFVKPNSNIIKTFNPQSDELIYFCVSKFMYELDGWYRSFTNIAIFSKAYLINPEKTIQFLFELMPEKLSVWNNRSLSSNLINALTTVSYKPEAIRDAWIALYDTISDRFPSIDDYNWDLGLENELSMKLNEIYICILFTRFKSHTIFSFEVVLSNITKLLYDFPQLLIKPLKWFFQNQKKFKKSIIYTILETIYLFDIENIDYIKNFETELIDIYPTNYFLIDYLIEKCFNLEIHKKIETGNEIIYPIEESRYEFMLQLNIRHEILSNLGINLKNIFGRIHYQFRREYEGKLDLFYNRVYKRAVDNIYFSDYMLESINTELYNIFNQEYDRNQIYKVIKIDTKTIVAQHRSTSFRPLNLKAPSKYDNKGYIIEEILPSDGWVRLAHYERESVESKRYDLVDKILYGGVIFNEEQRPIFPYSGSILNTNALWNDFESDFDLEKNIIISFIQDFLQFEHYKVLWLNPRIFEVLNLRIGYFISGLYARNEDDEIVLNFKSWHEQFYGSKISNSIRDQIARFDGSELVIREDYFKKICDMYEVKPSYCIYSK